MILLMKQEILESYITYIFDFFQKSRCFKAGQGNMLRNFRFAAEKQFTRNQLGILYFLVNTLIDNGYLYLKDRDFIALTENGAADVSRIYITVNICFDGCIDRYNTKTTDNFRVV